MSELARQAQAFIENLKREGASEHTVAAYASDLAQFLEYLSPPDLAPPEPRAVDHLLLREWMASLYQRDLNPASIQRKLAAIRSLFKFMLREGVIDVNIARLVRTPKAPKKLPDVMTAEQTNQLIDDVASAPLDRPHPERDRAIFELLYGCGLRVSELAGLNLDDIDRTDGWIRVRGKGRKERQVPLTSKAAEALERYVGQGLGPAAGLLPGAELPRSLYKEAGCVPVFLNHRGGRLTTRGIHGIVKMYATALSGDPSIHPHSFRHAYATHLLADGADLRAIQELLGHARLSTTQKYTQVALTDLMAVYDKAHPKAKVKPR